MTLAQRSDASGTLSYQYDAQARLTRFDSGPACWIEYAYDPVGNRTALRSRGGTVNSG